MILEMSNLEYIQIKDLKAGLKNINLVFIVLDVGTPTLTKDGRSVRTVRVGDASACVNLSVWDEPGALLQGGDIVRLTRGYASPWRGALTLYAGKTGDLQKVGEFCMLFNEAINMSEIPAQAIVTPGTERSNGTPVTAPSNAATVAPKPERFGHDYTENSYSHKGYGRGRGHQRGNGRR